MNDEHVPTHGRADVAFAGAQLSDAWLFIGSIFVALFAGSTLGWLAYVGVPVLGLALTKAYIRWKGHHLPGHLAVLLYRLGLAGYSSAFDRQRKLFLGDSKVINPSASQLGPILRAGTGRATVPVATDVPSDDGAPVVENDVGELVS